MTDHTASFAYESTLSEHSALRLAHLLAKPIWIHSPTAMACGMPPLEVVPCLLLQTLVQQLRKVGIAVADVALEGSAAAAFVCPELNVPFNDIDVVVHLDPSADATQLHLVRDMVSASIGTLLPRAFAASAETFISKMFLRSTKEEGGDSWALFTLASVDGGPAIDIKCVQRCSRPYQFSIDSVRVGLEAVVEHVATTLAELRSHNAMRHLPQHLPQHHPHHPAPLVVPSTTAAPLPPTQLFATPAASSTTIPACSSAAARPAQPTSGTVPVPLDKIIADAAAAALALTFPHLQSTQRQASAPAGSTSHPSLAPPPPPPPPKRVALPAVPAGSYYGSLGETVAHLTNQIIAIKDEAEVSCLHGGGLLKYTALRARGSTPAPWLTSDTMERLMCARFAADFPERQQTRYGTLAPLQRVCDYLATHTRSPEQVTEFLRTLRHIVARAWPSDSADMQTMITNLMPTSRRKPLGPRQPSFVNGVNRRRSFVKA